MKHGPAISPCAAGIAEGGKGVPGKDTDCAGIQLNCMDQESLTSKTIRVNSPSGALGLCSPNEQPLGL